MGCAAGRCTFVWLENLHARAGRRGCGDVYRVGQLATQASRCSRALLARGWDDSARGNQCDWIRLGSFHPRGLPKGILGSQVQMSGN